MKTLLKVKFEYLVPVLFITLFVMSIINVGFFKLSLYFSSIGIVKWKLSIPASYFAIRISRKSILYVWYGEK